MSLTVVGSIALDTVETPMGTNVEGLGGSAVYFSLAAQHFSPVHLVGVVGEDFPAAHVDLLERFPRFQGRAPRAAPTRHGDHRQLDLLGVAAPHR